MSPRPCLLALMFSMLLASNPLFSQTKPATTKGPPVLIPRETLFGNPEKAQARLSPDGKYLSYLAPVDGVLNVFVAPTNDFENAKVVTKDKKRGIRQHSWAHTSQHILYVQDNDGDEDFHVYSVNLETSEIKDLTPIEKIAATIDSVSEKFPEEIVVGINDRGERYFHDLYKVNVVTGERKLLLENPGLAGFVLDDDYKPRIAIDILPDGGQQWMLPEEGGKWKPWQKVSSLDGLNTAPAGFDKSNTILYLLDSRGRNTAALKAVDLKTGKEAIIAEDAKADIGGAITHPTEKTIQAISVEYLRQEWRTLDPEFAKDFEKVRKISDGDIGISSRTLDDKLWTVGFASDTGSPKVYLFDREKGEAKFLFSARKELDSLPLVKMHPVVIKSRDGLNLVSYLTLPLDADANGDGKPEKPLPLILNVHGGPWARDSWGYDPEHQLFANRGYAVLSVNFRSSTGFGKEFTNAGNREWAAKMHDDLLDAVKWAIDQKIAQKDKVAIMGGSYGGYATLVGLTFTPDVFCCGVDVVGPSNLVTLLENPPPYWMPQMPIMKQRVGDYSSDEGKKFLESRSPLFKVDSIVKPLFIAQGAKDPRVKQQEADQIVKAMEERKIPVTYMLFHDEGHGFARPENRFAYYAAAEQFLSKILGGRAEPIGKAFDGSNFSVPSGKDGIPGYEQAGGK
jgi:dipeptidyl aminopeptidase/acylaminoacyl peptidase